jgi:hypothetical protein
MLRAKGLRLLLVIAAIAVAGILPALTRTTIAQDGTPSPTALETKLRFLHASPGEDDHVKISLNGDKVLDDQAYGNLSDYVDAPSGEVWVKIEQAGMLDLFDLLYSAVYPAVSVGNYYQIVMTDNLVISSVVDRSPIPEGKARLRFLHNSPNTPDLDVVANGADTALFTDLRYPFSSDYVLVDPGSYDFDLRQAGMGTSLLTVPGVNIEAGQVYDIFVIGIPTDPADKHPLEALIGVTAPTS